MKKNERKKKKKINVFIKNLYRSRTIKCSFNKNGIIFFSIAKTKTKDNLIHPANLIDHSIQSFIRSNSTE